jgi:methyl-accepting chemotaxis protein WspA
MKNWTVQKLVMIGFLIVISLSIAICAFSLFKLNGIQSQAENLNKRQVPGLYYSGQILQHMRESDAAMLRYIVLDDSEAKARAAAAIEESSKENTAVVKEREDLISGDQEKNLFDEVKTLRANYLAVREEIIRLVKEAKPKEALALYEVKGVPSLKRFADAIGELEKNDKENAFNALGGIDNAVRLSIRFVLIISLISLCICLGVMFKVLGMLAATLKSLMMSLIQVNGSATEMAATIKEQQASANEVASTSVEIGATAKEISATTQELGKTMSDVASVSEQTAELAAGGQTGLTRLEGTMRQIMGATTSISSKLAILNEKTANINSMVTTINKVADQTNLLSLNAAIEAEKAGEYGQGFAVVATEIRRLADQTAVATYDIEQMVKEMQSAVSAGVMGMDKFAEEVRRGNEEVCGVTAQLGQIIGQVQALTPRFESVNDGMQMQSTAAGQISDALTQLGDTAQQSAQALRQNSEAIEQLTKAAQGLQVAAAQLKSDS